MTDHVRDLLLKHPTGPVPREVLETVPPELLGQLKDVPAASRSPGTEWVNPPPAIQFYRANEKPFGVFSNLFRRPVVVEGREYPTVEHAYQSLKPRDPRVRDWLLAAPAPSLLALAAHVMSADEPDPTLLMGRTGDALLGFHTRPGWSRLRYPWMLAGLVAKFDQHPDLAELLLSTGDAEIIEAGKIDDDAGRRWGIVNGRGANYLGRMLMRVRQGLGGPARKDADLDARLAAGAEALATALAV